MAPRAAAVGVFGDTCFPIASLHVTCSVCPAALCSLHIEHSECGQQRVLLANPVLVYRLPCLNTVLSVQILHRVAQTLLVFLHSRVLMSGTVALRVPVL